MRKRNNKLRVINCIECSIEVESYSNRIKFCKSCASKQYYKRKHLIIEYRLKRLLQMAKNRAKDKGVDFNIDYAYLLKLWIDSKGCCTLTGKNFDLNSWGNKGQVNPNAPSLDRIIPNLGYIKNNVRLITYHMNISLSDFGVFEFEKLIKDYLSFKGN